MIGGVKTILTETHTHARTHLYCSQHLPRAHRYRHDVRVFSVLIAAKHKYTIAINLISSKVVFECLNESLPQKFCVKGPEQCLNEMEWYINAYQTACLVQTRRTESLSAHTWFCRNFNIWNFLVIMQEVYEETLKNGQSSIPDLKLWHLRKQLISKFRKLFCYHTHWMHPHTPSPLPSTNTANCHELCRPSVLDSKSSAIIIIIIIIYSFCRIRRSTYTFQMLFFYY